MAVTAVLCAACDAHIDVPDTAVRPGHILCEDGTALSYVQYEPVSYTHLTLPTNSRV